ncbi:hypothetical protein PFICI_12906 [Pestalotiopsis fici W106-1]|uniref:Clr5 domain-containing protein n=1 Tax=Pestalotiopsis fici (strain W106-1 / CGMCC3.15140) TaxID=1229662 RepID=W3WS27_PESFW|nr:uncharacterized protein PFICI_12906 [Pestalotiopsis fici W106-1]ETS75962.1 hypothetical protein PFICI_12906 [Pestalotiopsis fici W106-1]
MYKHRIKLWGLTKNLSAGKVRKALWEASRGKATLPVIRGRVPGPASMKHELQTRLPREYSFLAAADNKSLLSRSRTMSLELSSSRTVSPSPVATSIDAPAQFRYIESCLAAVLDYTRNRVQTSIWDRTWNIVLEDYSEVWHNKIFNGLVMIRNGKMKQGFQMIDICLKNYKSLIQKEHPLLIIETYSIFLRLSLERLDLAHVILRYIAGLCRACLGPAHPFSRIWTSLMPLGMDQIRTAAAVVIKAQLALLATYFAEDAEFLINQRIDTARQTHCYGSMSIEEAEADIAQAIRLKEAKGDSDTTSYVCWAKEMLASIYQHNNRFAEAKQILDEVGREVESQPEEIDQFTTSQYFAITCQVIERIGTYQDLKDFYQRRLDWCVKTVGKDHQWTVRTVIQLDTEYGKRNDFAASVQLHQAFDFESSWNLICRKEDSRFEHETDNTTAQN